MVLGPNVGLDLLFSVVDRQMVDDAHASGALGRNGRGSVDHFGMHGKVDVQVGTLSKAIGALGGYVCGTRDLIDYLYHRARPFLFSTSHPPSVAASCIAAFDILETEPERIERLWANTRYFQGELTSGLQYRRRDHAGYRDRLPDRAGRQGTNPRHPYQRTHAQAARPGAGDLRAGD